MKTNYVPPSVLPGETTGATLTRLSADIGTLTSLIQDSEAHGSIRMADMFSRSRQRKISEARRVN